MLEDLTCALVLKVEEQIGKSIIHLEVSTFYYGINIKQLEIKRALEVYM